MQSLLHRRIVVVMAACLCLVTTIVVRPMWRGAFAADLEMGRAGADPIRLGVHGGVGPERPPAVRSVTEVHVVGDGNAPFEGPTADERAAIDELRAALHEQWLQMQATMARSADGMHADDADLRRVRAYPEPEVRQPLRHLTGYEIVEIRNTAAAVRRAVAAGR